MWNLASGCSSSVELGYMFCFVVTLGKTYKRKAWPGHAPFSLTDSQRLDIAEQQLPFKPGFSFALGAKVKFLKKIHPNNPLEYLSWGLSGLASVLRGRVDELCILKRNYVISYNGNKVMSCYDWWFWLCCFSFVCLVCAVFSIYQNNLLANTSCFQWVLFIVSAKFVHKIRSFGKGKEITGKQ